MILPARIDEIHRLLNSPKIVPKFGYRRNSLEYPLICYVNNIIGLLLAENYLAIPTFVRRAHNQRLGLLSRGGTSIVPVDPLAYLDLVGEYLPIVFDFAVDSCSAALESCNCEHYQDSLRTNQLISFKPPIGIRRDEDAT